MASGRPPLLDGGGLSPVSDDDDQPEEFISTQPTLPTLTYAPPSSLPHAPASVQPRPSSMEKFAFYSPYNRLGIPNFMSVFPTTSTPMGDTRAALHPSVSVSQTIPRSSDASTIPFKEYPFISLAPTGPPPHPNLEIPVRPSSSLQSSIIPHHHSLRELSVPTPSLSTLAAVRQPLQIEPSNSEIKSASSSGELSPAPTNLSNEVASQEIERVKHDTSDNLSLQLQSAKPVLTQIQNTHSTSPTKFGGDLMSSSSAFADVKPKVDAQNALIPAYASGSTGLGIKMESNPSIDAEVRIFLKSLNRESIALEASRLKIDMTDAGTLFSIIRDEFLTCSLNNPRKLTLFLFFSSLIEPGNSATGPFRGNQVYLCELGFNLFLSKIRDELAEIVLEKNEYLRCIQNWKDKGIYSAEICDHLLDALTRSGFSKHGELQFHSTFSTELMKLEALHDALAFAHSEHLFNKACEQERTKLYREEVKDRNLSGISMEELEQDASNFGQVFSLSRLEIIALNRSMLDVAALVEDNIEEMVSLKARIQELKN